MAEHPPPAATALVVALLLLATQSTVALLSVAPPDSLTDLAKESPADFKAEAQTIAALGSSQQGIKHLVENNLFGFAEGLPPELATQEPGLSLLASAAEAYSFFYPGVDFSARIYAPRPDGSGSLVWPTNRWYFLNRILVNGSTTAGNGVTYYGQLWYDFNSTGGPIVLTVPPTEEEGYWIISFYDAYLAQFAVVGTRNTGNEGGKWLLVPPNYNGSTAGFDADHIIESPNTQGFALARVAKTTPDVDEFLTGWNVTTQAGAPPPSPAKPPVVEDTELALQVRNATLNSQLYFWELAGKHFAANPKQGLENPLATQLANWLGFSAAGFDAGNITDLAREALTYAPQIAGRLIEARYFQIGPESSNYWSQWVFDEIWGTDYLLGAAIIKGFWVANYVQDAAYYYQYLDSAGLPLLGNNTYRFAFPAAPPYDPRAFWSLQVFDLTKLTYPGAGAQGYGAGYLALKVLTSANATTRADGSFDILLGPSAPSTEEPGVNFLQTVTPSQIHLILRVYYGSPEITGNSYVPPAAVPQPLSLTELAIESPADFGAETQTIAALGSSQQGIRHLIQNNLYGFADGIPAELTTSEPGLSLLASAAEAYSLFYPGVDFASRIYAPRPDNASALVWPTNRWFWFNRIVVNGSTTAGNGVTYYGELWYDFNSTGPIVLTVPPTAEQGYWLISFYDAYYSQFAVVGTRNTGNDGGEWLLVPPTYNGSTAGFDADQIIKSPNTQGFALARVARTTPDVDTFISDWNVTTPSGGPTPSPARAPIIVSTERALQAQNTSLNSDLYFWQVAGKHFASNPKAELEDPLATQLAKWFGFSATGFNPGNLTDLAKEALTYAPEIASRLIEARYFQIGPESSNYWSQWVFDEIWGTDYLLGAAIIKGFWVANYVQDAAYYYQYLDSAGLPLTGNRTYKITFPAAPPHDPRAFWSVQVFDLQKLTYPGVGANGYGAGYLALKVLPSTNATARSDGSFDIILGPSQPSAQAPGTNFLQTVTPGQFHLILRVYYGSPQVIGNSYVPPAVVPQ
ncbi:hypothetical protein N2152v2_000020 [Parachlorella kessleri]